MNGKVLMVLAIWLGLSAISADSPGKEITLPANVSTLRPSDLPGYAVAQQKCGICHSADYINYQAPGLSQAQWTAEAKKMQHAYGAPLDEQDIQSIGAYLAVAYGSAKATDASVLLASATASTATNGVKPNAAIDVPALLNSNACLGCHALDKTVVGPAYQAVAKKYRGDPDAQAKVVDSIRHGGVGKWGNIPMPPMSTLTEAQAKALAAYVLKQ